ncbi:MAG: hypothetical protein WC734_06235, partial [Patescibacteria group bacterium]
RERILLLGLVIKRKILIIRQAGRQQKQKSRINIFWCLIVLGVSRVVLIYHRIITKGMWRS